MRARGVPYLLQVLGVALAYGLSARLGQFVAIAPGNVSALWPPSGIAVAAIALFGTRIWPGVWLGSFAYNFLFFLSTPIVEAPEAMTLAVGIATGSTLMAVVACSMARVVQGRTADIRTPADALVWTLGAGFVAPLISASAGTTVLKLAGMLPATPGPVWRTWWLGDATGIVLITPAIILWARHGRLHFRRGQETEALIAACAFAIICLIVFGGGPTRSGAQYLLGVPLLFLSYTALRFGRRVTATTTLVLATVAVWATAMGRGPLLATALPDAIGALQLFICVGATLGLTLAAIVAQTRVPVEAAAHPAFMETGAFPLQTLLPLRTTQTDPDPPAPAPPPSPSPPPPAGDLDAILSALPDPVYVLDRDTLTITRCNEAFARTLGLPGVAAAEGRSLFDLFAPALALMAADEARRVFHTGEPREDREHWTDVGGADHEFAIHRAPLRDSEGQVTGLVARAHRAGR